MLYMETNEHVRAYPLAELIRERRTVRLFRDEPLPEQLIVQLLNVAAWAPNHNFREPWRFILYQGDGRQKFSDAVLQTFTAEEMSKYGEQRKQYYAGIPAHLIVVQPEDPRAKQREEDYAAVCCLIQNFQLAAWERGIGMVWKTNPYMSDPRFRESASIGPGEKAVAVLHLGYPAQVPPARQRTAVEQLLTVVEN